MLRTSQLAFLCLLLTSRVEGWNLGVSSRRHALFTTRLPATKEEEETTTTTTTTATSPRLNPLLQQIQPSKTVEIFSLVKDMQAAGQDVTSLCVGEPDFAPPKAVLEATLAAVQAGDTKYTAVTGTAALRQAICDDLKRRKGLTYNPSNEIVVANGAKQAVFQGLLATAGVGDTVLIPAPYWPSYPEMVRLTGATPVLLPTEAETGYILRAPELRAALEAHPTTKVLILCHPSNPTGSVYTQDELAALAAVLKDYPDVWILADEIYERLVYTGKPCPSIAAVKDMWQRTLLVNGMSKAYAMTGYRLGYLAAPAVAAKAVTTIQGQLTSCASSLAQAASLAALTLVSDEELAANTVLLQEKRDYVLERLTNMPGVTLPFTPAGAFYVLPDVSSYCGQDDTQLCLDLLQSHLLALVPGSSFGAPGTVRISYATSLEELETAMNKLQDFLESRKQE